jgi:hypothetical protein
MRDPAPRPAAPVTRPDQPSRPRQRMRHPALRPAVPLAAATLPTVPLPTVPLPTVPLPTVPLPTVPGALSGPCQPGASGRSHATSRPALPLLGRPAHGPQARHSLRPPVTRPDQPSRPRQRMRHPAPRNAVHRPTAPRPAVARATMPGALSRLTAPRPAALPSPGPGKE